MLELLEHYGHEKVPCAHGSALQAIDDPYVRGIAELAETRYLTSPFLMTIEGVCTIPGRGTVVTGRVERGRVAVHNEVQIIGRSADEPSVVVTGIQEFHQDIPDTPCADGYAPAVLLRGERRTGHFASR